MSIIRRQLGELFELLGDGMHCVDLPSFFREHRVDHGRGDNDLSVEGHNTLQLSKVRIGLNNSWSWPEELEVVCLGVREKVFGSSENCWSEIECALIPGEG